MEIDLTVLICTHCSAKRLPQTLDHLKKQKHADHIIWEVIIVDYVSSDDTVTIAKDIWHDCQIPLRVIHETEAGKTPALESGLKSARGVSVCIVDDDNWVNEDYVTTAHKVMKDHPDVGVIGAFGEAHCEIDPPEWFDEYQGVYAVGSQGKSRGYVEEYGKLYFWGAGCVIRREAWLKAKARGFVPILNPTRGEGSTTFKKGFTGGEDPELCFAIQLVRYRLWYEPDLKYKHFIPKGRLTPEFIDNAIGGVSAAGPILRVYLAEVTPFSWIGIIRRVLYKSWSLHMLYLLLKYSYLLIKTNFQYSTDKSLLVAKTKACYSSQIRALLEMRRSFRHTVKSIERLRCK